MLRLFLVFLCMALARAQESPPCERVFDGQTLNGWRGDQAVWSVRDGCITASTAATQPLADTFLVLDGRQPANFEFSVMVRLQGDNNGGVQYRSRLLPGDGVRVAGYQCDLHPAPNFLARLHDEQGVGIVAEPGEAVRWRDDGRTLLGGVARPRSRDLGQWHQLRILAMGDLLWHVVDGTVVTVVKDEREAAPRAGVIALQLHGGASMTMWCKDITVREYPSAEVMRTFVVVPEAMQALLRREELRAALPKGQVPMWIWDESAGASEEVFFRRTFAVGGGHGNARLAVTCDNHSRIYVNGERVGKGDAWETPVVIDVTGALHAGENVVAVHGSNDGGPAALAVRLSWQADGQDHELVSDGAWTCSSDDPDRWNETAFDGTAWPAVRVLAAVGAKGAPWTHDLGEGALGTFVRDDAPQVAVVETGVEWLGRGEDPEILHLLSVPRALGSWVSLCADDSGRLYASDQKSGLYRIVPATAVGELSTIERMPVDLGGCHGLLWFQSALYAVQNGDASGLYRVTDSNGDDRLDRVDLLRALDGEGEHGPHSVVVAPDGENLLVVCGNQTKLPALAASRVPTNWAEDRLLPRLEDPNRYFEGISPPGGWVCLVDPEGQRWELLCCGFRNPYDLVVLSTGAVVTFDSDMEWDMGLPWYRPTRLLRVVSGVDYGWRIGSAKWPADYPDAPPALVDLGPGSPTGMAVWSPRAFLALDWTFGTVYENGKSLLAGAPLPVADVAAFAAGGRRGCFLLTGGRGLPSRLLRTAVPDALGEDSAAADPLSRWGSGDDWPSNATRKVEEILDDSHEFDAVKARIALERLPVAQWRGMAVDVAAEHLDRSLTGLLALARQGAAADLQPVLQALGRLPFATLVHRDRIAWLRVHALALLRLGPATDAQRTDLAARLLPLLPTGDERQDADLAELLAYVEAPGFLDKAVPLLSPLRPSPAPEWADTTARNATYGGVIQRMLAAMPPTGQIAIANALCCVQRGWTLEQRRTFFTFLVEARTCKGGASYDGYLKAMADAAWSTCTPAEQEELAELVGKARADAPKFVAVPPKGPGRDWQLADADALLRDGLRGRDLRAGHNLFHAIGCATCHYFAGEGGNHGPDLTSLGNKFTASSVLEAVLEPSRVTSDQYTGAVLTKLDGTTLFGRITKTFHGDLEVWEVVPAVAAAELVRVPVAEVAKVEPSKLSPMPADLVDRLSADELKDLLAFLLSRGQGPGRPADGR